MNIDMIEQPMTTDLQYAIQTARKAGQLLLQYFHSANLQTNLKTDRSLVTEADLAVDRLITAAIQERYPDELLISEELQPDYPPGKGRRAQKAWIVDPLDGTTNFGLGLHFWGVLLARLVEGWPDTAVLYFPLIDELYSAQSGQGAYLNGKPIRVQTPNENRPLSFFACCSRTHRHYQVSVPYKTRILGSAAYTLCAVARGTAILGFEVSPKIWDIASAWLLVNEAGGAIETLDKSQPFPLRPGVDYPRQCYPTLAAATPELIKKARIQITPRKAP
jgi:myo-inositol-1(or 4)-monophosphatase